MRQVSLKMSKLFINGEAYYIYDKHGNLAQTQPFILQATHKFH